MKTKSLILTALVLTATVGAASAQTNFDITTPGSAFQFSLNGSTAGAPAGPGFSINNSPPITLAAGATYTFNINTTAGLHPVDITTAPNQAPTNWFSGASPQAVTTQVITLTIPATGFPTNLYYICNFHGFYGVITVVPPAATPPPPANTIVAISLTSTNVTVTSSGATNTYQLVPQYNSNLVDGAWLDVPAFSNTFANGTNTTTFDRLEPICGPNVFVRISQRPPN